MLRSVLLVSLLVLAPFASISFSEKNEFLEEDESKNLTSTPFQNAALIDTSAPLRSALFFDYGIEVMDVQGTFDNRIIATWTLGVSTASGFINPSIRIFSFPSEGSPDGQNLEYSDLTLDRSISIPVNMSHFRYCQSNLLSDQAIIMVCGTNDVQNAGTPPLRIDISGQSLLIPQDTAAVFVWNSTNHLQTMWIYDDSQSSQCNYGWFTPSVELISPLFINDSFIVILHCLSQNPTYLGNSSITCSNGYSKCSAIAKFDRNGTVENIVYMRREYLGDYPCDPNVFDVNSYGYIEFQLETGCVLKNSSGTTLYTTTNIHEEFVILDSQLNYVRSHARRPDGASADIMIMDVETTHNQTYFTVGMADSYSGFTSTDYQWLGQNISRYLGTSISNGNNPQLLSIVSKYNSNQTTRWAYTWPIPSGSGQFYDAPEEIRATSYGIFWIGPDGNPVIQWDNEVDYRTPPYPGPTSGNQEYSVVISENGTWIDNPKWAYMNSYGYCNGFNHNVLRYTGLGISCADYYWDQGGCTTCGGPRTTFEIMMYDVDGDGVAHLMDAFPNDHTQWYDEDLDGYGNNASGFLADDCKTEYGNSTLDRFGCLDTDGDGQSNLNDVYPTDATQYLDTDYDGYGDNLTGIRGDYCPTVYGESNRNNTYGCPDVDFDGWADTQDHFPNESSQWADSDGDGYGDQFNGFQGDNCPNTFGSSHEDIYGCPDADGDGWSDSGDDLPYESTQWKDGDGDGYGNNQTAGANLIDEFPNDATQWNDTDGDGHGDNPYGSQGDKFPLDPTRWQDTDDDGYADEEDAFPNDATQWNDTDGDGHGDNPFGVGADKFPEDAGNWSDIDDDGYPDDYDAFPTDLTQWNDTDGDGYGDEIFGTRGDSCPDEYGNSTADMFGCIDTDGDGVSDVNDAFDDDPSRWQDTDDDGYSNDEDLYPNDGTQWADTDGDGYGDETFGTRGDSCPNEYGTSNIDVYGCLDSDGDGVSDTNDAFDDDPSRWQDTDGDGYGDLDDPFPFDPTQWADSDGDGYGDNPLGLRPDAFPTDSSQWSDVDGDGWGDNATGNNADIFITDITQWSDIDGDGYGDNQFGINPDAYPKDATQWADLDGDGLGDNTSGNNPDPFVNDTDNDGYNNSIDPLPNLASPGDMDGDGCLDEVDAFPTDSTECLDSDNDGQGDNQDDDDDGDGVNDITEIQSGTNPLDVASKPVDLFEIAIPGTAIGLGAWDLIGIFGGVPFFTWLAFCLVTRGARSKRLERDLFEARSELELSEISDRYEWALLWKLIGPHQALRLERIRSNLEFNMNEMEAEMNKEDYQPVSDVVTPPSIGAQGTVNTDGYEWIKHEGVNWYRLPNTNAEWIKWQ